MNSGITIMLLAAGASTRMKAIKQLLPWNEIPLLRHMVRTALSAQADEVVVILGAHAGEVRKSVESEKIVLLENPEWAGGMGSTIHCGMQYLTENEQLPKGVLLMVADQPLMDRTYLDRLINTFESGKAGIVGTLYGNKIGVPALFAPQYFEELRQLDGETGAQKLIRMYASDCLGLDAGDRIYDLDAPEDYKRLLRIKDS